ncbi:hypothetical protein GCM10020220_090560 [Nonomuraea rubra]
MATYDCDEHWPGALAAARREGGIAVGTSGTGTDASPGSDSRAWTSQCHRRPACGSIISEHPQARGYLLQRSARRPLTGREGTLGGSKSGRRRMAQADDVPHGVPSGPARA